MSDTVILRCKFCKRSSSTHMLISDHLAEVERLTSENASLTRYADQLNLAWQERVEELEKPLLPAIADVKERLRYQLKGNFTALQKECIVMAFLSTYATKAETRIRELETALEKINALQLDEICGWEEVGRTARDIAWKALEAIKHPPVESKGESQ